MEAVGIIMCARSAFATTSIARGWIWFSKTTDEGATFWSPPSLIFLSLYSSRVLTQWMVTVVVVHKSLCRVWFRNVAILQWSTTEFALLCWWVHFRSTRFHEVIQSNWQTKRRRFIHPEVTCPVCKSWQLLGETRSACEVLSNGEEKRPLSLFNCPLVGY